MMKNSLQGMLIGFLFGLTVTCTSMCAFSDELVTEDDIYFAIEDDVEVVVSSDTEEADEDVFVENYGESFDEGSEDSIITEEYKPQKDDEGVLGIVTNETALLRVAEGDIVDSGTCGENLTWTLDSEGTLTISGLGEMTNYSNEESPFGERSDIGVVIIEKGVTGIGYSAFPHCENLTSLYFPQGLERIGDFAFCGCNNLTSVDLPDSLMSIGDDAFYECSKLTDINLPDTLTSIGDCAFEYCTSLTSVDLPDRITSIGVNAFYGCTAPLMANTGTETAKSLSRAYYSFWEPERKIALRYMYSEDVITGFAVTDANADIEEIVIPEGVTSIGDNAFYNCNKLTSIIFPESLTSIGENAFSNCSRLTSIILPESLTSIGDFAFDNCTGLASIELPETITSIGNSTLYGCPAPLIANIGTETAKALSKAYYSFREPGSKITLRYLNSEALEVTGADKDIEETAIPKGVTSIGSSAFSGCSNLTGIDLPDTLTSIGEWAFNDCSNLTGIDLPDTLTSIGDYAFYGCNKLTDINLPESLTSIGDCAFRSCSHLKSIAIGSGVNSINNGMFESCSRLTSIDLPDTLTSIGDYAFLGCERLTKITIPESLTSIGDEAFFLCSSLTSIDLPNSVTNIGRWAFNACTNLTSINLPDGLTSIEESTFAGCNNLVNIILPDSVTNIGDYAFSGCSSLTSIDIPNRITRINEGIFSECSSLKSFNIPENVTYIGDYSFRYCNSLSSITIPESVTWIGEGAFACRSLQKIIIPPSLKEDNLMFCLFEFGQKKDFPPAEIIVPAHFNTTLILPGTYWDLTGERYTSAPVNRSTETVLKLTHVHTWDSGRITKAATIASTGVRTYTCTSCRETRTESIPKLQPSVVTEKITITKKPSLKKLAASKGKITVKWKHFKHTSKKTKKIWKKIKKIQVQCSTDKAFKNIVKTATVKKSKTSAKIKGLEKKTTYYVRVRYYDGTGYSNWSRVKKVKTNK